MADHGELPDSFENLDGWVASTLPRAVAYAASLLRDRTLADDVVHDCYCRLLRKADTYNLLRDGTKLLFRSITHESINRNHRERPAISLDHPGLESGRSPGVEDPRMIRPIQPLLDRELESAIARGLASLPVAQRAALELKSLGHSHREIAEALETTPGNASVLVHRARQAMADHLAFYLEEPPR